MNVDLKIVQPAYQDTFVLFFGRRKWLDFAIEVYFDGAFAGTGSYLQGVDFHIQTTPGTYELTYKCGNPVVAPLLRAAEGKATLDLREPGRYRYQLGLWRASSWKSAKPVLERLK